MTSNEGVTKILNLSVEDMGRAAELEKLRRNITVLFTDLKGSTNYFEKYGDAAGLLMVHRCNSMLGGIVERHGGRVIKTIGDAVMASFEDHAEAVAASIEMQEAVTADNKDKTGAQKISIRIGINYGPGIVKSDDIFGDVVNVASRVESAAAPEQILISDTLYQAVSGSGRFRLRALGKFALKGKAEERDLYEVGWKPRDDSHAGASHSMIVPALPGAAQAKIKLVQIRTDGQPGRELDLPVGVSHIGRDQCEFAFPNDAAMSSPHTRLFVESGQLFVEPVGDAAVFFSLIGPYRLREGDVVKMGSQVLEMVLNSAAVEMASMTGAGLSEISAKIQQPVAEFVATGIGRKRYAIQDGPTTWGRTKGTYAFPIDTAMSRSHAKVYHRGEDFFIEDTGSTNGTFVRAREKTPVPPGATLSISGQLLKVKCG